MHAGSKLLRRNVCGVYDKSHDYVFVSGSRHKGYVVISISLRKLHNKKTNYRYSSKIDPPTELR
jgi:hypothetical protein